MVVMKKYLFVLFYVCFLCSSWVFPAAGGAPGSRKLSSNFSHFAGIRLPDHSSFNAVDSTASSDCNFGAEATQSESLPYEEDVGTSSDKPAVKLHLKHRSGGKETESKDTVRESTLRDTARIHSLSTGITNQKKKERTQNGVSRRQLSESPAPLSGQLMATLQSGVSLGSGEYFMDVFIGTPRRHYSMIVDTGSDLNWIQCLPCNDCFEQKGPFYDPAKSKSFRNILCSDPKCRLVNSPDPTQPCKSDNQTCPYYYWYGDSSNTTGDFATETFTVNLTTPSGGSEFQAVENVMFGCGHWNRGLFHGAAGLLGLGRGPLSFSSQLDSLYRNSFSYCLVDRNSRMTSKLIFGEDKGLLSHPELNFTSLVSPPLPGGDTVDTFYYVEIKSVLVGGEVLDIPEETWKLRLDGGGGAIVDSGTTLSYFAEPAYSAIKKAFISKVGLQYHAVKDFPILTPCYKVSGLGNLSDLPSFGIRFSDGATWNFPVENYFIRLVPEELVCLAILGTPKLGLSIIGNYQQQNFHILYDTRKSRLGFAPTKCAEM